MRKKTRIEQFAYLSPQACELRRRDGTPPWSVHPCEVDDFKHWPADDGSAFGAALREARALRAELERDEP
jgi:hypothetical protein